MNTRRLALAFLWLAGCAADDARWLAEVRNADAPWAIHGTIVGDDGVRDGWVVFHRGVITSVGESEESIPKRARVVRYPGHYLFPGLIDTHNHAPWNVLPHWRAGRQFGNRYQWINDPDYRRDVNDVFYNKIRTPGLEPAALKYAKIRALIGGTTALQSTFPAPEPRTLIRTLDGNYLADSRIPNIRDIPPEELQRFLDGLASADTRRIFIHLAEGKREDPDSKAEFAVLRQKGLVRAGVVLIHGVALGRPEFREMARAGMHLVWSPRSNEVLYGETARILEALEEGLTVAVAPDWTITGSDNVLQELKVAQEYSNDRLHGKITPRMLFRMATTDAAKVAGVESYLGKIAPKYGADLVLAPKIDADPYRSLLQTRPRDLHLVFVDGLPVYGDLAELKKWVQEAAIDEIAVDGATKGVVTLGDPLASPRSTERFKDIVGALRAAVPKLADLVEDPK